MGLTKKDRKFILATYPAKSIKELAREFGARPREVQEVLEAAGRKIVEPAAAVSSSWRPLLVYSRASFLGVMTIVAAISVIYLNSSRNGFHYDDIHSLLKNLGVQVDPRRDPASLKLFARYFVEPELFSSRPQVAMPRPILMCTFGFNYMVSALICDVKEKRGQRCEDRGYDPRGWVLMNILIHVANSAIIYVALCHLTGRKKVALLAALIFALHPGNTETVNYINCRSESLTVFFMLLTMYFFTRALWQERVGMAAAFAVCQIFGLLTKELAFTTAGMLVVIDILFIYPTVKHSRPVDRLINWRVVLYGITLVNMIAYLIYRKAVLKTFVVDDTVRPIIDNLLTQVGVLVTYLRLFFFPLYQNISYENATILLTFREFVHNPFRFQALPHLLLLGGLLALAVVLYRRLPVVSFAIALFFVTLSITSVVPLNALMNEHRLYLPSLGPALLLAVLIDYCAAALTKKSGANPRVWPPLIQAATVALLLAYGALTVVRNFTWHTDLTVWRDSIRNSPEKAQVVSDLGNAYYRAGGALRAGSEFTADRKIDKKEKLIITQTFHVNVPVGDITPETKAILDQLNVRGLNRAEQLYTWAIRVEPDYYKAFHNLGTINFTYASLLLEKRAAAISAKKYEEAVGYEAQIKNTVKTAMVYFEDATKLVKNGESFNDWGSCFMTLAELETDKVKRIEFYQQSAQKFYDGIRYNPELPKAAVNLGYALDKLGRTDEAIPWLDKAIALNPKDGLVYLVKASMLYNLNKYPEALQTVEFCLRLIPGHPRCEALKKTIMDRLNSPPPTPP